MVLRIFRHFVPLSIVVLAVCETAIIFATWYLYLPGFSPFRHHLYYTWQSPSFGLSVLAAAAMLLTGLYSNKVFVDGRIMATQIIITFVFLSLIGFAGLLYWRDGLGPDTSLWEFQSKAVLSWLVCILITRLTFLKLIDLNLFRVRVLVMGTGNKAARIAALAGHGRSHSFVPMAFLQGGNDPVMVRPAPLDTGDADAIVRLARELRVREIIVASDDRRGLPVQQLLRCRIAGIRVIDYLDFIERETKTVDFSALQPSWLIFSDGFRASWRARASKRCFDILLGLLLLLFTLPLMLLTCLLIKLDSAGPVLYRQERVGLRGRSFVLLKFRSMRVDAEKDGIARWAVNRDPRITRLGRFIRKVRIDELPQLINVLKGDMSFVGPRPERPGFVADFTNLVPFYAERHCVKPGITGWAQINYPYGASLEDARNKLSYDLYYVKNHSLFLDLTIVLQTLRVILCAEGAR